MADSLTFRTVIQPDRRVLVGLLAIVAILPMLLVAFIIDRFGVNVPYADEWSIYPLMEKWAAHQLSWDDLFQVHNQHRILFPRLFFLALMHLTHGNLKAEMYFSLFLCILTSFCILVLLQRTVNGSTASHLALWALVNLFLFSPVQAENWLWGFQLQIFLSSLCVIGAIACITAGAAAPIRFGGAVFLALAATFSFGNGLLVWPAVLGVLICRRERIQFAAGWAVIALLVGLIYVRGYPAREPTPATTRWIDYLLYFAGFLGTPLARIPNRNPLVLPVTIGGLLVAIYLWIAIKMVRSRALIPGAAPWLALGGYAIASAIMAASARIHSGPMHALDSRYTTVSLLLLVSVISSVTFILTQQREETLSRPIVRKLMAGSALAILLALYVINLPFELRYLRLSERYREVGKSALQFSLVLDLDQTLRNSLLIRLDPERFARCLRVIDQLQFANPPRRQTLTMTDAANRLTEEYGVFERLIQSPDAIAAQGWAVLPDQGSPASSVVLAYRVGEEWKALGLADTIERRSDVAEKFKIQSYLNSGWKLTLAKSALPPDANEISAWVLDADRAETYRLPNSFRLLK